MIDELKNTVCKANKLLPEYGLTKFTWGNVSAIDRQNNAVIIKPSGMKYSEMNPEDMVVVHLDENRTVEGRLMPSVDLNTHIEMYLAFPQINSIVHTHSKWATIWAQAKESIVPLGTTHADDFFGEILCTREMQEEEIADNYEKNTGLVIVETMKTRQVFDSGAVLVRSHGPFVWGTSPINAVEKAVVLEEVANMAWHTRVLTPTKNEFMKYSLLEKHYFRKHGDAAYYGQSR